MYNKYFLFSALLVCLYLQGCATLASSSNAQTYDHGYEDMTEIVEWAINGSNILIDFVDDSKPDELTLIIVRETHVTNQKVQGNQGRVIIRKMEDGKTQVEIENPSYHFSVSDHQRVNYRRIIFNRINERIG